MPIPIEQKSELNVSHQLLMMVYSGMMAALISVGAYIAVPVGPVPIILQNMFVMLAGLLLGSRWGLASVGVYLLAGICGLPVFSGGGAGLGHLLGPTGGYLVSYLPAVFLIGFISEKSGHILLRLLALLLGSTLVYLFGVGWLQVATGMTVQKAIALGMLPFLVGDAIKIAAALAVSKALLPIIQAKAAR
ncbi:biotin transporter BioY [Desulfogranum japonicum]|uniref:biotin transporter BioY n=1 Tax=Desulfogranum japonicum TaxID=231447 RepID=UPI0003F6BFBD|nr:biotin transporter BioY [Desulfogranum japonicum]